MMLDHLCAPRSGLFHRALLSPLTSHGCFWHECPHCHVAQKKIRSNLDYWLPKPRRNKERDERAQEALTTAGWRVFVVWECQVGSEPVLRKLGGQLLRLRVSS